MIIRLINKINLCLLFIIILYSITFSLTTDTNSTNIDNSINLVLKTCDTSIKAIQTIISAISMFLGILGIAGFVIIMKYKKTISQIDDKLDSFKLEVDKTKKIVDNFSCEIVKIENRFSTTVDECRAVLENIENKNELFSLKLEEFNNEIADINCRYKNIQSHADALHAIFELKNTDENIRLTYIAKLSQLLHPCGIYPLISIALDKNQSINARKASIYALSRYAKLRDINNYLLQIIDCFDKILSNDNENMDIIIICIDRSKKFERTAKQLLKNILKWSRNGSAQVRLISAQTFEGIGVYEYDVFQRLKEMELCDVEETIKKTAKEVALKLEIKHDDSETINSE